MKLMAIDVYRFIRWHVEAGGWLGASWPTYVLPRACRVTNYQLDAGYEMALREGLLEQSRRNFNDAAAEDIPY